MLRFTSRILTLCLVLTFVVPAHAQEGVPEWGRPDEMDQVGYLLGDWDVTFSFRMSPDQPWTESSATATTEAILDGCVQRMTFAGDVMGMPLNGMDHLSFNRETGKFESFWVDNMGANFSFMSGDHDGTTMVLTGKAPRMGEMFHMRATSTKVSDDEVEWVMEESADGGETWYEGMKMTYVRKK